MSPLFAEAQKRFQTAQTFLDLRKFDVATYWAFFTMLYAARALLASQGLNANEIKDPYKVRALLRQFFVETGQFKPELADVLASWNRIRRIGQGTSESAKQALAREMVHTSQEFLNTSGALLLVQREDARSDPPQPGADR